MSRRRLDRLEGSLSPLEAALRWLAEAHAYGSLPAYVESLIDQPLAAQPFVALPTQVADAVYRSMRGQRSDFIKEVTREAVGDTVFLLRLVLGLNVYVERTLRNEELRQAALYWWSRALDTDRAKGDVKAEDRSGWHRGIATLCGGLLGTERARAAAESRYLDGHDCFFPELAIEWQDLRSAAELMALPDTEADEVAVSQAEQQVQQVVLMARADGLDAAGQGAAADAMATRVARLHGASASGNVDG